MVQRIIFWSDAVEHLLHCFFFRHISQISKASRDLHRREIRAPRIQSAKILFFAEWGGGYRNCCRISLEVQQLKKINAYIKYYRKQYPFETVLFCDDVADLLDCRPAGLLFDSVEFSHLVECCENASCHTEGNHYEEYYKFHDVIVFSVSRFRLQMYPNSTKGKCFGYETYR